MDNNIYNDIILDDYREIIESWIVNNTLAPICFEDIWFYHCDEDEQEEGRAKGSMRFNPIDNTIEVSYDFIDDTFYNKRHFEVESFIREYQPIIVKESFYTILTVNDDSEIGFFTDDDKTIEILVYIKYWNQIRESKLKSAIDVVTDASNLAIVDDKLVNATINFIEMLPLSIFTNHYIYTCFNIRRVDYTDDLVRYYEDCGRRAIGLSTNLIYKDPQNIKYVTDLFNEYVSYNNVISKYIDVQEEYRDSVIKVLFRHVVYDYFAQKWEALSNEKAENHSTLADYITEIKNNYEVFLDDELSICYLAFYLCKHNFYGQQKYPDCRIEIDRLIVEIEEDSRKQRFEKRLFQKNSLNIDNPYEGLSISGIDLMSGKEFEMFIADMFKKMGYSVRITKESGDQGIDVIAERNGTSIGIQAKCYSSTVGNYAVQEAVAGGRFYQCNKTMVLTNRYFTESAISLASANEVILWDRDMIISRLAELYE